MSTEGKAPDAIVWATSTDLAGNVQERKVYFILIKDGDREINVALTTKPAMNEVHADMYVTPDYNYTIHDHCDHEMDQCVLDDPDFEENWYGPQPGTIYQEVRKERLEAEKCASGLEEPARYSTTPLSEWESDDPMMCCVCGTGAAHKQCAGCKGYFCMSCFATHIQDNAKYLEIETK